MSDEDSPSPRTPADEATDPATAPDRLYDIVVAHPHLRADVAANPAIYPELRAWLAGRHDPDIDAALELAEARAAAGALPADPGASGASDGSSPSREAPAEPAPVGGGIDTVPEEATAASGPASDPAADDTVPTNDRTAVLAAGTGLPSAVGTTPAQATPAAHTPPPAQDTPAEHDASGGSPGSRWKVAAAVLGIAAVGLGGWLLGRGTAGRESTAATTSPATAEPTGGTTASPPVVDDAAEAAPSDAPSPTGGAPTPTDPGDASPTPTDTDTDEPAPAEQLEMRRQESLEVATFDGHWAVQLASKYDGQVDPYEFTENNTHTFYLADIWREHQRLTDLLAAHETPVYLFDARDFGRQRERHAPYWVTVADPGTLETEEEAWEFCASLFPDRTGDRLENSCVPRELLPPFWP